MALARYEDGCYAGSAYEVRGWTALVAWRPLLLHSNIFYIHDIALWRASPKDAFAWYTSEFGQYWRSSIKLDRHFVTFETAPFWSRKVPVPWRVTDGIR